MSDAATTNQIDGALARAVRLIGSQVATARLLGVTQGAVSKWLKNHQPLPPEHVLKVEERTGISRHDLRPDIYGPAPTLPAAPAEYEHAR